jgi:hypothetical protein
MEKKPDRKSMDLKAYSKQTTTRLIVGALLILIVVGLGLIYLFYGPGAVFSGFLCVAAGILPILLIYFIFIFLDWIVKRYR